MFIKVESSDFNIKNKITVEEANRRLKIESKFETKEYSPIKYGLILHRDTDAKETVFNILYTPDLIDGGNESLLKFIIKNSEIMISKEKSYKNRDSNQFLQFINSVLDTKSTDKVFDDLNSKTFDLNKSFIIDVLASAVATFEGAPSLDLFKMSYVEDCFINDLLASDRELAERWTFLCPLTGKVAYDAGDLIAVKISNKPDWSKEGSHEMTRRQFKIENPYRDFTFFHKDAGPRWEEFRSACIKRVQERKLN